MLNDYGLSDMSRSEREWYERILTAFPRGFSANYRDGKVLRIAREALRVLGVKAGVPRICILDPFHSLEWDLISIVAHPDGSWTVRTSSSGLLDWKPLTDEESKEVSSSWRSSMNWWEDIVDSAERLEVDAPESEGAEKPSLTPALIQEHWHGLDGVVLAKGLFDQDDPMTGEVYPLREPLFVLHCDAFNRKTGLWQISEDHQFALYPDDEAGRANRLSGRTTLEACKGWKASWASVVDRITRSSDVTSRWYALANPNNLALQDMFETLQIGQAATTYDYTGMGQRPPAVQSD